MVQGWMGPGVRVRMHSLLIKALTALADFLLSIISPLLNVLGVPKAFKRGNDGNFMHFSF